MRIKIVTYIVIYLNIAFLTYGYAFKNECTYNRTVYPSIGERYSAGPTAFVAACIRHIYLPCHWSRLWWEKQS